MRVVRVDGFGTPDVLRVAEADRPTPESGQVLVKVEVAAVLFADTLVRRGVMPWPVPYVPGMEVGGVVDGRRVVARTAGFQGGYAEFALAEDVHPVPDGMSMEHAVTLYGGGDMAIGLLDAMRVDDTDTVLITAAAGRIGSMLVQLAKARGARVIPVASPGKLPDTVAYDGDWGEPTVVLDSVGGQVAEKAIAVAKDRVGLYGFASGSWPELNAESIAQRGLTIVGAGAVVRRRSREQQRADAHRAMNSGMEARIHAVHPLEDAAKAHLDIEERRNIGAVLLRVR
ncbi:alanine dehydrogenase [Kibdelosporangium aridum]|uniref:Alanine dehydrogenase n=1 Tax=Kibdelosporangium aridum TaxID=2030 RepID=A0A428YM78_KIBAR|nr:zinc-binding dehydrogenase [Kibdelosporangium aridum]RSM68891.1 alanine dehydrogenase [Kibdelosporangium aridum]